jgi:recombinational DNA repair ATPase RecF
VPVSEAKSMALATQAAKRRCSYIELANNPLENISSQTPSLSASAGSQYENLVDTVQINQEELQEILRSLERTRSR